MKKILTLLFLSMITSIYAQENGTVNTQDGKINTEYEGDITDSLYRKNELRVNALGLVLYGVGVSYERILNDDIGVGVSALLPYGGENYPYNYYVAPYGRYYFGKKPAGGIFVEGFGILNNLNLNKDYDYNDTTKKTSFGLGFGIGQKWVKRSGFNMELSFGVGRNLNNLSDYNYGKFIVKGGFHIGFRFL